MSEVLIYEAENGQTRVDVRLDAETVWLTQEQMAALFGRERSVVTKHLRNVFKEGELDEKSNVKNLHIAGSEKPIKFYNLDTIISVGYRVKSQRGVQFRQWATRILREHLVHGYTLNSTRLAERGISWRLQAGHAYMSRPAGSGMTRPSDWAVSSHSAMIISVLFTAS